MNTFYEKLIDEYSKNSNKIFTSAPMNATGWIKRRSQRNEKLQQSDIGAKKMSTGVVVLVMFYCSKNFGKEK